MYLQFSDTPALEQNNLAYADSGSLAGHEVFQFQLMIRPSHFGELTFRQMTPRLNDSFIGKVTSRRVEKDSPSLTMTLARRTLHQFVPDNSSPGFLTDLT